MLFESAWKLIWLDVVAVPLWRTGQMDAATRRRPSRFSGVIVLAAIPWRYVLNHYALKPGARWR